MVGVQAVVIPQLRQRLLVLGRERQLTARALAGRIAEVVDGAAEIHAHDTSNYERAEISARLGRIFRIRFELYQRKFLVKFLNNFLSQVTPFLFYTVGGYLVITGQLDIGALVAVIAAYKDLPAPVKELIDWDQQRMDVEIKYTAGGRAVHRRGRGAGRDAGARSRCRELPREGKLRASGLTLIDDGGARVLDERVLRDRASTSTSRSSAARAASELAQLLTRLRAADQRQPRARRHRPDARARGGHRPRLRLRRLAGVPVSRSSVRDNIVYGLKHAPLRQPARTRARRRDSASSSCARPSAPAARPLDIDADWIDYAAAGVSGPEEMEQRIVKRSCKRGRPGGDHLRARPAQPARRRARRGDRRAGAGGARRGCASAWRRSASRTGSSASTRSATTATRRWRENLLFGTPVGKTFDIDNLAGNRLRAARAARHRHARAPAAHRPQGRRDHGRAVQRPAAGPRILRPVQLHPPGGPAAVRGDPEADRGRGPAAACRRPTSRCCSRCPSSWSPPSTAWA